MKFVVPMAFSHPTHYCALARTAEDSGWDCVAVSDHVVHPERIRSPYPYTPDGTPRWQADAPWPDPFVAIGAMAATTQRLQFFTNIFVLPMRNPFLVAKAVGTASLLSGGRVALGIGVGWMQDEFELLGQDFKTRGRRTDEMIAVMRKLWKGGMVEHHGQFYQFDRLQMSPPCPHPIPLYGGGLSEVALRRAATLCDGWISDIHTTAELREIVTRLRGYRREAGRSDEALSIIAAVSDAFDADRIRRLGDLGVTHYTTMPWLLYGGGMEVLEDKLAGLRRFADEVIAKVRD
jgi:probable F420-dependent oxidoreductase